MSLKLAVGSSDFRKIIEEGYYFVDKSLFIQSILDDTAEVLLFTRPRRFGKSLNLSMLYYFLESQLEQGHQGLFDNLKIKTHQSFCERHHNQYPVILISFKDIKKKSFDEAYEAIALLMSDLYERFRPLLMESLSKRNLKYYEQILDCEARKELVQKALYYLCQWLNEKTGQRVIILIDEYDTPMTEAYIHDYYDSMVDMMRSIMSWALKDNVSLKKGVVTGITHIAKESIFSDLNNLTTLGIFDRGFSDYFGFTEKEVAQILKDDGHPDQQSKVKTWYNGYQFGDTLIYNPWSIISCIYYGYEFSHYWVNSSSNKLIKHLLGESNESVKGVLEQLLQGKVVSQLVNEQIVFSNLKVSEEALWGLLLTAGYLKVVESRKESPRVCQLAIPNKEISLVFQEMVRYWFSTALSEDSYQHFVKSLVSGEIEIFSHFLNRYLQESGSYFDFNRHSPEKVFHTFVLGLVVGLQDHYMIQSNRESGLGRFDVLLKPKDLKQKGILLEFKLSDSMEALEKTANLALKQIKDKEYTTSLKAEGIRGSQLLGIAFYGQKALIAAESMVF